MVSTFDNFIRVVILKVAIITKSYFIITSSVICASIENHT